MAVYRPSCGAGSPHIAAALRAADASFRGNESLYRTAIHFCATNAAWRGIICSLMVKMKSSVSWHNGDESYDGKRI